jgi:2-oxoglutarate dehydrogenase E2 component (dihydrolipoamide succinyltransferase)
LAGTLSSIKVKEGDTVEVGALVGIVNEGKSSSIKTVKTDTTDQNQQTYIPPETSKKTLNKRKKIISKKQEPLTLIDESEDKNSNGTLILDALADEDAHETKEEKYIPPKTRQHLSPSVRKIVEEKNIDISSIKGTGKAGRISKGDLISLMGDLPKPSKRKITHGLEERVKMSNLSF